MRRFSFPQPDLGVIQKQTMANRVGGLNRISLFEGILGRVPLEKKRPAYQIIR